MDKELLDLLNNARQSGANETQLQGIVDAYNVKKKGTTPAPSPSSNGQLQSQSQESNAPNPFDITSTLPKKLDNSQQPLQFRQPVQQPQQPALTPENNFGMPSANEIAKQNISPTDNPTEQVNAPQQAEKKVAASKVDENVLKDRNKKIQTEALDNATDDYFKSKNIVTPKGSALYNEQRQNAQAALDNGLVTITKDKDGNYGLNRQSGFWENLKNSFNEATQSNDDNANFVNGTRGQRLAYLKANPDEALKHVPGFVGERPDLMGSVGNTLGSGAPFMLKAAAGTVIGAGLLAAAPESAGTSLAALPAATSFLFTAPDLINQNAADEIKRRFYAYKQQGMSDEDAMDKADEGKWIGGLTGLGTAVVFSREGVNKALSPESKGVIANAMEHVIKPSLKIGATTGGMTALQQEEGNLEGVGTSQQEIFNNSLKSLQDNGTSSIALLGLIHYAPKLLSSAYKYALAKDENPADVQETLQANEDKGIIPEGTTQKITQDIHDYADALKQTPAGLTPEAEASYAGLVVAKSNLQKEMLLKDPTAQLVYQPKIDAINGQLQKIIETNKPNEVEVDEATGKNYAEQLKQADETKTETETPIPNTQEKAGTTNEGTGETVQPTEIAAENENKNVNLQNEQLQKDNTENGRSKGEVNQGSSDNSKTSQKEKGIFERAKAVDATDPYDKVLQYFSGGGKIHNSVIDDLFGNNRKSTEGQRKSMIGFINKNGQTIDELAHSLWENDPNESHTTQDYKNAIEDALQEHTSPASMAKELVSRNDPDEALKKFLNERYGEGYGKENVLDAVDHVENMSTEEINHLLELDADQSKQKELENYIDQLSTQSTPTKTEGQGIEDKNIAYKGSGGNVNKLQSDMFGDNVHYVTDNEDYAKSFALDKEEGSMSHKMGKNGKVEKYDISGLKTYDVRQSEYIKQASDFIGKDKDELTTEDLNKFNNHIKSQGYDAIKVSRSERFPKEGGAGFSTNSDFVNEYLVFDKSKLKNITEPQSTPTKTEWVDNNSQNKENEPTIQEPPINPPKEYVVQGEPKDENKVGVSHKNLTELANKLGLKEPQRGEYIEPHEYAERGRQLLKAGATLEDVNNPANELHDRIAIARAQLEDLTEAADKIGKTEGIKSDEYKDAVKKVEDYYLDKVKKLGTLAHRAFVSLQGERDLNTGSFTAVKKAFEANNGSKATDKQTERIVELTKSVEDLRKQNKDLEEKLIAATDKDINEGNTKTDSKDKFAKQAKDIADKFRKLKSKGFKFKDENGNEVDLTKMGVSWNDLVEFGAKAIEATGKVADGVAAIVEKIKDSDFYAKLSDEGKKLFEKQLTTHFESTAKSENKLSDLHEMFADKRPNDQKFTPEEAKAIWDYAKEEYLNKGVAYRDMISYVANDIGLKFDQVFNAITTPKTRPIADEAWLKQRNLRRAETKTRDYVERANKSTFTKVIEAPDKIMRGTAVYGHGGIFVGTHAGMTLTDLPRAKYTVKAFLNGYKFAYGNDAAYERSMQKLQDRPTYTLAQRSGLQNNPNDTNTDQYQKAQKVFGKLGGVFKKIGESGVKGFNAIKVLRQDLFDDHWNRLTPAEKADPETARSISELVNNATGATNLDLKLRDKKGNVVVDPDKIMFAANMEAARWEKLTKNPAKATGVALKAIFNPSKATAGEKTFAKVWGTRVGWELSTYAALVVTNALIQSKTNPKNPVNLTDPTKPDYMKFKVGNTDINMTSGMLSSIDFVASLAHNSLMSKKQRRGDNVLQADAKTAFQYGRGKLAPFSATLVDLKTGTDYAGNTLPYNKDKPSAGKRQLSWGEYGWEKAPIPIADAAKTIHETMLDNGLSKPQTDTYLKGLLAFAEAGTTGFRISDSYQRPTKFTDIDKNDPVFGYWIKRVGNLPETSDANVTFHGKDASGKPALIPISDSPKKEDFDKEQKAQLKIELAKAKNRQYVYVDNYPKSGDSYGNVKIDAPENPSYPLHKVYFNTQPKDKQEELNAKILSAAQGIATKKAKKKIFKEE